MIDVEVGGGQPLSAPTRSGTVAQRFIVTLMLAQVIYDLFPRGHSRSTGGVTRRAARSTAAADRSLRASFVRHGNP